MSSQILESLLTCKEVSEILQISKALAYRLVREGTIPSFRVGKVVRVKTDELQRFIDQNSVPSKANEFTEISASDRLAGLSPPPHSNK